MKSPRPDFDLIARPYRWIEHITFGSALERCRFHFLSRLQDRTQALVLGDGDGRFLARLLQANSGLHADAVDASSAMLHLLRERCRRAGALARLRTHHMKAQQFLSVKPGSPSYDLVVTHFFLDCLTQQQLDLLVASVRPHLAPGTSWVISDFRIPSGAMHFPALLLVRGLYLAFRILTGLRVTHLPAHKAALTAHGFRLAAWRSSFLGTLSSEFWVLESHPIEECSSPTRSFIM